MTDDQRDPSRAIDPARLDKLAEAAVKVGLRLEAGQPLLLTGPVEALPLVRRIAHHAYEAGASLVTPLLTDPEVTLSRYRSGRDASFDAAAGWLYDGVAKALDGNTARLAVVGDDPMLLSGQDAAKVARASKAQSIAYRPALDRIAGFAVNWTIVAFPGAAWARQVFPGEDAGVAERKLAEAIFAASRVDGPDPVASWAVHNAALRSRTERLNAQRFSALHYGGPGTDLTIGLADGHEWQGGASTAKNGITCNPNIPTEEVFTTPHALRVEGSVSSTKPLAYQGTLVEGIAVRFEGGRIVEAHASRGQEVLNQLLDTDEGARRLGEVALVPHSSPISRSGLLFFNTLFDENAACHIALGQCYAKCLADGATLSLDEIAARGGNGSAIHVDWMIGSDRIDIDGVHLDGSRVPIFRRGEWV